MLHVIPPMEHQGRVTYLDPSRHWGYLEASHDHRRLYFDEASIATGLEPLRVGDLVRFIETAGHQEHRAVSVALVDPDATIDSELPQTD
jgi:hypothetical protein